MAGVRRDRREDDQNEASKSAHFNVLFYLMMIRASSLNRVSSDCTEGCEELDSSEVKKRLKGERLKSVAGMGDTNCGGQTKVCPTF
jgi:hypothetical protein